MGMDRIMANTRLSQVSRIAKVKSQVLQHMDVRTEGGRTILVEISDEVYYYDRTRDWLTDEMTTTAVPNGQDNQGPTCD